MKRSAGVPPAESASSNASETLALPSRERNVGVPPKRSAGVPPAESASSNASETLALPSRERNVGVPPERSAGVPPAESASSNASETLALPFLDPYNTLRKYKHNLPHWQQGEAWQFVTWRLGDSLPAGMLVQMQTEKESWMLEHPKPWEPETEKEYHRLFGDRMERWLDAGHGSCVLKERAAADVVAGALRYFDGQRYALGPYVIMPNHVHVLFQPLSTWPLEGILHSWKSFTAKEINRLRNTNGPLWQQEYWDRMVRGESQWYAYQRYIERNPKGLKPGTFILGVGSKNAPF